jgi:predicted unusual protein kinase regulating ubiquinone biosynthesis (AarF/ABC1/UbiB family)
MARLGSSAARSSTLPPLMVTGGGGSPSRHKKFQPPRPGAALVLVRLVAWLWAWIRMMLRMVPDRARRRLDARRRARHVRRALEAMGGTTVKIGQQIALRLDVMPLELASELAAMVDTAPPLDFDHVVARVSAAAGRPLDEVFRAIDPEPIRSDSISCVYQAVLHDGEKVAVKVQRPMVARQLNADRVALEVLTRLLAPFSDLPLLDHVLAELPQLLFENLDYVRVARLQRLFRREARRSHMKLVTAADIYIDLCSEDVIVSEFVTGVWLTEVIAAQETNDTEALAELAAMGIHPERCGRRLLHICWWGFFENLFLCELPRPSDIVVQPGGRLVFIDLGDTGMLGWRQRKLLLSTLERLVEHDMEGAVAMLTQLMLPLPYIDVHEFSKKAEASMWGRLFAMENADSHWRDRSSTGMWVSFLQVVQLYGIPVRLDISRMIQAMCMYDHMAGRLWPRMRILKELKRYLRQSQRRNAKRVMRAVRQASSGRDAMMPWSRRGQLEQLLRRANLWLESVVESVPVQYIALSKKGAHSTSLTIHALAIIMQLAIVGVLGKAGYDWLTTRTTDLFGAALWVVRQPVFIGVLVAVALLTIRRIMHRLDDMDPD